MEKPTSATMAATSRPLQILPAMLHAVMLQTAEAFSTPQKQHPRAIIHTNAHLRASIPAASERFQQALDALEMEILRAKATLTRDLSKHMSATETERLRAMEEESASVARAVAEKEAAEQAIRDKEAAEKAELEKVKKDEAEYQQKKEQAESDAKADKIRQEAEEKENERMKEEEEDQLAQAQLQAQLANESTEVEDNTAAAAEPPEVISLDDDDHAEPTTKEEPIVLDSSSPPVALPETVTSAGADGSMFDDLNNDQSNQLNDIDLFGEDPLGSGDVGNADNTESNDNADDMELMNKMGADINIDDLFDEQPDGLDKDLNTVPGITDDDLTFDLDSEGKLDLMNLDLPTHLPGEEPLAGEEGGDMNTILDFDFPEATDAETQPGEMVTDNDGPPAWMTDLGTGGEDINIDDMMKGIDDMGENYNDMFESEFSNLYSNENSES